METIKTPRIYLKPVNRELAQMPVSVTEYIPEGQYDEYVPPVPYVKCELTPLESGKAHVIELFMVNGNIAAMGGMLKQDYEDTLAWIDRAAADNESGEALRLAMLGKDGGELIGIISLFDAKTDPVLHLRLNARIRFEEGDDYDAEAIAALLEWVSARRGLSVVRWYDERKGQATLPPDTLEVFDPRQPDKKYLSHIDIVADEDGKPRVTSQTYEKPRRPEPEVRRVPLDCGRGLTLYLDITLEQDVIEWGGEPREWSGSCDYCREFGDTADEVIASITGYYGRLFKIWRQGPEQKDRQ